MLVIGTLFFSSCTAFILCIVYSSWPQDVWAFYVRKGVHFIKVKAETSSGWWLRRLQPHGMISSSLKRLGRTLMIQPVDIWDSHLHVSYSSCPPKKSHQTLQKSPLSTISLWRIMKTSSSLPDILFTLDFALLWMCLRSGNVALFKTFNISYLLTLKESVTSSMISVMFPNRQKTTS